MMTPETIPVRVSILERLVPSLGFALAAISGATGSAMLLRFLSSLRQAETAGIAAFFGGVTEIEFVVGAILAVAAGITGIGILVSIVRMFTTNKKASPPGLLFLMTGLLSLVPPFALHYILHAMKEVVISPTLVEGGISGIANTIVAVAYFAIGTTAVIIVVVLVYSFVPFSSRPGRKTSPLVCLLMVEIVMAFLVGVYFWEAGRSLGERDRDRSERYSRPVGFDRPWESRMG